MAKVAQSPRRNPGALAVQCVREAVRALGLARVPKFPSSGNCPSRKNPRHEIIPLTPPHQNAPNPQVLDSQYNNVVNTVLLP